MTGSSEASNEIAIDVIVPVYNALSQTERCIASILAKTTLPYRLILVNDGSEEFVSERLREITSLHDEVLLLENPANIGFVKTVNRGLELELDSYRAGFKVILNSDTVVTEGWLEKLSRCFHSSDDIGIACPLSNNAENLSIQIPSGENYQSIAAILSRYDFENYPDVTTAVGFCMAIRTELLRELGGFDLIFSPGYGEESDYHFKTICRGYRSVLVPNCFIYHESHASFSARKERIVARNRPIFDSRWKRIYLNELVQHEFTDPIPDIQQFVNIESGRGTTEHDILFFLPTSRSFGGVIVCFEVINRLCERGYNASAVVLTPPEPISMNLLFTPYFIEPDELLSRIPPSKVYVATLHDTVQHVLYAHAQRPESKTLYLIQGYEGWFADSHLNNVRASYAAIPTRICVSHWLDKQVGRSSNGNIVIPNGIDTSFFVPTKGCFGSARNAGAKKLTLLVHLREDPQNGWKPAFEILRQVKKRKLPVRIVGVGNKSFDIEAIRLLDQRYDSLDRAGMRNVYAESDIFLDTSLMQGFGLMGLEAMASGVATIMSKSGGVESYATEENSLLVNICDIDGFVNGIERLCNDRELLLALKRAGHETAQSFAWSEVIDQYEQVLVDLLKTDRGRVTNENYRASLEYFYLKYKFTPRPFGVPHAVPLKSRIPDMSESRAQQFKEEIRDLVPESGSLLEKLIQSTVEGR